VAARMGRARSLLFAGWQWLCPSGNLLKLLRRSGVTSSWGWVKFLFSMRLAVFQSLSSAR